jgi:hypothetical protein
MTITNPSPGDLYLERIGKVSATVNAAPRPNLSPGPWVHYKFGAIYELMQVALHEGTGEWHVVHRNRQTMNVFVRPAREWEEPVRTSSGVIVPRFRQPNADGKSTQDFNGG